MSQPVSGIKMTEYECDVVTPNLKNETLISLRTVHDAINALYIDLSSFVVPKELLAIAGIKYMCINFAKIIPT